MAIVKFGPTVTGIRGTVAGLTFTNSHAGPYVRPWRPSAMPRTANQTAQQARLTTLAPIWQGLSGTQHDDWNTFALTPPETDTNSLGEEYLLTGFQWFIRLNVRNIIAGEEILEDIPGSTPVVSATGFTIEAAAGDPDSVIAYFDSTSFDYDPYGVFELAYVRGAGRVVQYSAYYQASLTDCQYESDLDLTASANALFGRLQAGNQIFARLRVQSVTGIRSPSVTASCVIS